MGSKRRSILVWLIPILLTIALTSFLMVAGRLGDMLLLTGGPTSAIKGWLFVEDPRVAREVILAVLEVLAAIFAISITVVAIIVQLAATRYTSRVVDLFLADPLNAIIFFAYLVPLVHGFWLANTLTGGENPAVSVGVFMIMATLSIILIAPYFKFVFHFLQPSHIIDRIERSIETSLGEAAGGNEETARRRREVSNSIRQLSDIALSSIAQSDIVLSMQCMQSLRQAGVYYLSVKKRLPSDWFEVERDHLVGLSHQLWRDTVAKGTWVELEIFKQYEIAFTSSLRKVRDINSYIARSVREIAVEAQIQGEEESLALMIKGMNTFITHGLGERDIRSTINVLYQYRLLGETFLQRPELLGKIASHLRYYAQNSARRRIFFIVEVIAYDLRVLTEKAFGASMETCEAVLAVLLDLIPEADPSANQPFRHGLRKSQGLLAGFFIRHERLELVKRVFDAMAGEEREVLAAVRSELLNAETREFWEIEDRGESFYFLEKEHRGQVDLFFAWLLGETPLPSEIAQSA